MSELAPTQTYSTQRTSSGAPYIPLKTRSSTPIFLTSLFPTDAHVLTVIMNIEDINNAFGSLPKPYTLAHAEKRIAQVLSGDTDLALCALRSGAPGPEGRLVGGCSLALKPPTRNVGVGYFLHPDFHGLGIVREALRAAVTWGRRECGVNDVRVDVADGNVASRAVVEKIEEFVLIEGEEGVKMIKWPDTKGGEVRRVLGWVWTHPG